FHQPGLAGTELPGLRRLSPANPLRRRSREQSVLLRPDLSSLPSEITPLHLHHPDGATPVIVGDGALSSVLPELEDWLARRTVFLVTTPRVLALHGERLDAISRVAARWVILEVEEGEAAKSVGVAERLWNEMLAAGGKRDSRLMAFG